MFLGLFDALVIFMKQNEFGVNRMEPRDPKTPLRVLKKHELFDYQQHLLSHLATLKPLKRVESNLCKKDKSQQLILAGAV